MNLYYREMGEGAPLIILHGLFGASDNWLSIGKSLSDHFNVYLLDQRNHGQSPHSEEWTYDAMAADVVAFMDQQGIEKATLLGHSMGGKVAMFTACLYPDRLADLIVADIAPRHYPVHHRTILDGLMSIDLENLDSRKEADSQLAKYVPEPAVRQFLLKSLGRDDDQSFSWKINLKVINDKIENVGIALPKNYQFDGSALFIRGAKSHYVTDEDAEQLKDQFPNSKLVTIERAGHWIHAEQSQAFIDTVLKYKEIS